VLTFQDIDPRQLVPNERNPKSRDQVSIADLLASIPEVGITTALLVTPAGDDSYRIVAGHRRWRAAIELGLATVPCLVAVDDDTARDLKAILVENTHRVDLTTTEQGQLYAQLTLLHCDEDQIAAFTTRPVEHVRAAIRLTRMPTAAQKAADTGVLTLEDAAVLADFSTDPGLVEKVLKRGAGGWGLKHAIADAQQKLQAAEAMERCKAELVLAGVKVVKPPKGWPYGEQQMVLAKELQDTDGNPLDPEQIRTRPGFAAILTRPYGGTEPKVEIVCTDPQAWGYAPAAGTSLHAQAEREAEVAARGAFVEEFATATQVRWQFLAEAYGSAKAARAVYLHALRAVVADPDAIKYPAPRLDELAVRLAGTAITAEIAVGAGIDRLTRMLVARWLCAAEANLVRCVTRTGWDTAPPAAVGYLDLLVAAGYVLSDAETTVRHDLANPATDDGDEDIDIDTDGEYDRDDADGGTDDHDTDDDDQGDGGRADRSADPDTGPADGDEQPYADASAEHPGTEPAGQDETGGHDETGGQDDTAEHRDLVPA
jgi:ParB family chromosome partitioning protein